MTWNQLANLPTETYWNHLHLLAPIRTSTFATGMGNQNLLQHILPWSNTTCLSEGNFQKHLLLRLLSPTEQPDETKEVQEKSLVGWDYTLWLAILPKETVCDLGILLSIVKVKVNQYHFHHQSLVNLINDNPTVTILIYILFWKDHHPKDSSDYQESGMVYMSRVSETSIFTSTIEPWAGPSLKSNFEVEHELPGSLNDNFLVDGNVVISNHFPSKDLESSNLNNHL